MVGYPDKFRDYSALEIRPDDLYGNVQRANRFNADYDMEDLGKPVNRKKWGMNPQTVNAYNGGAREQDRVPGRRSCSRRSSIPRRDAAVNYGAIGAVIGHEISHGFDDQGRKIDATGAVRDWWTRGGRQALRCRGQGVRRAVCDVRGRARRVHQPEADDGREHRRLRRHPGRATTPIIAR